MGSPTPTGSRTPSFPCWRRKEEEIEKEKGAAPLVQFGPEGERRPPSFWPLSSIPVTPRYSENTRITRNLSDVRI